MGGRGGGGGLRVYGPVLYENQGQGVPGSRRGPSRNNTHELVLRTTGTRQTLPLLSTTTTGKRDCSWGCMTTAHRVNIWFVVARRGKTRRGCDGLCMGRNKTTREGKHRDTLHTRMHHTLCNIFVYLHLAFQSSSQRGDIAAVARLHSITKISPS